MPSIGLNQGFPTGGQVAPLGATDVKVRIKGATSKKRLGTPGLDLEL